MGDDRRIRGRIAIDAGQTGTRARISTVDGRVEDVVGPPIGTHRPVVGQLAELARAFVPGTGQVTEVAAGVSGLTAAHRDAGSLLEALADTGITTVLLAHDSITAYLAANRFEHGVTTAAGTGVVTLGVGPAGLARVDGWGHLFGDAGSAYWIGRAGIDAALRAFDGRGPQTTLQAAADEEFGSLPELYMRLQGAADRVPRTAAFAKRVAEEAEGGDHLAHRILEGAATELAHSAVTALTRCGRWEGDPVRISWTGAVFEHNRAIATRFATIVSSRASGVEVAAPYGTTLDGAALLFDLDAGHPLTTEVARASRGSDQRAV